MKASDGAEKKRSSEAAHSTLAVVVPLIFFQRRRKIRSDTDDSKTHSRNSYRNYTERGPSVGISKFLFDIFVGVMRESKMLMMIPIIFDNTRYVAQRSSCTIVLE